MPKPNSLVTGGAGFIGSHVADELLKLDHRVMVLDDLSGGFEKNIPHCAVFCRGSILDTELLEKLFSTYRFDNVFHLAAYAAEGLSHFIKRFNYQNNLIGSVNLINAAVNHKVKHFVFTSSMAVYGDNQVPYLETMIPHPEDSYGIAKLAVERELEISHRMFGLDYTIFRPHNVYGSRQNIGDRYRNVVGIFMNQLMKGEPLTIFGDGEQVRAFSHISGVAETIAKAVHTPKAKGMTFNIGGDTPITVNQLADYVMDAMKRFGKIIHLPPRDEVKVAFSNHDHLAKVFGKPFEPSIEYGLAEMAAWVKEHGARESKEFADIEIRKNLPAVWTKGKTHAASSTAL